jgi:putative glutamine amidotransferase
MTNTTAPLIGVGADIALHEKWQRDRVHAYGPYIEALKRAGAIPLIIPPQPENVPALGEILDGIVLMGGRDCDPSLYGEDPHDTVEVMDLRRQENDLALARLGRELRIPTLGICLGAQVMNVVAGGSLIQDIASQHPGDLQHRSEPGERLRHDVIIHPGTRLAAILGSGTHNVNSSHHQAVRVPGEGLEISAHAPDGIVEAVEDRSHPFSVGVQWHPEDMPGEDSSERLFAAFVEAARAYADRRLSENVGAVAE